MNSKCATCQKMLYRTDPCKGVGVEKCGRTDGGSIKLAAPVAALSPAPPAAARALGVVPSAKGTRPIAVHGQKGAASESTKVSASAEVTGTKMPARTAPKSRSQKSRAKATKGKAERKRAPKPDGVASRPSDTAEVSQAQVSPPDLGAILVKAETGAAHLAPKRRGRKPTGFDKAAYNREFMRKKRAVAAARLKAEKEGKS